jgi:hypothetical protein
MAQLEKKVPPAHAQQVYMVLQQGKTENQSAYVPKMYLNLLMDIRTKSDCPIKYILL